MDRRIKTLALLGLAMIILGTSVGCRSTGNEVPRGRRKGQAPQPGAPAVEFSTQPPETRAMTGNSPLGGGLGNIAPSTEGTTGLPAYGSRGGGGFGPPGSAGLNPGTGGALGTSPPRVNTGAPGMSLPPMGGPSTPTPNPFDSAGGPAPLLP